MANKRDFYEVLGVSKNATEAEIKSAYRRLARQYHPDVDKTEGAAERFKEVSEAYQVLSDPNKRRNYDQFGHAAFSSPGAGNYGAGGFNPFGNGGFSYTWSSNGNQDFGNSGFGGGFADPFDLFEQIFGMGGFASEFAKGFRRRQTYQMTLTFDEAVNGTTKEVEIERLEGNHNQLKRERMNIKVPAGVDEGTRMRFGDVDIIFRIKPSNKFQREGADIYSEVSLTVPQAVLGDVIEVDTIHGRVRLKVPSGTQPGQLIRIKGKGTPTLKGGTGDHYVKAKIEIPKNVSGKEEELYQEIADIKKKKRGWF